VRGTLCRVVRRHVAHRATIGDRVARRLKRDLRCAKAIAMTKVCIVGAGAIGGFLGTHLAAGAIELDALLSAVREIGQRVGVATPLHEPGDDPATCPVGAQPGATASDRARQRDRQPGGRVLRVGARFRIADQPL